MDICNCLWRGRAFSHTDVNSLACLNSREVTLQLQTYVKDLGMDLSLSSLFGLSHSPILCLQSILSIRELEDRELQKDSNAIATRHAGPVTQASLSRLAEARGLRMTWPEYRVNVLRALEARGLTGIPELMKNTMKVLMNSGKEPSGRA
jgi:centromere protein I